MNWTLSFFKHCFTAEFVSVDLPVMVPFTISSVVKTSGTMCVAALEPERNSLFEIHCISADVNCKKKYSFHCFHSHNNDNNDNNNDNYNNNKNNNNNNNNDNQYC